MAKYEEYAKKVSEETVVEKELKEAADQQEERKVSTPDNWEKRYKDLEVAYSQQGQQIGDYRKLVDDYISTPDDSQNDSVEVSPITTDEIYENPDEAVRRAVDSHPAIKEAKQLKEDIAVQKVEALRETFLAAHPDFEETVQSPEFATWVKESPTRIDLATRGNDFDMTSADALFTIWEAEQAATQTSEETQSVEALEAVGLESSAGAEAPAPERYSRSEMLEQKIRAKQGNDEAERYVKAHAVRYREALGQGLVRD